MKVLISGVVFVILTVMGWMAGMPAEWAFCALILAGGVYASL